MDAELKAALEAVRQRLHDLADQVHALALKVIAVEKKVDLLLEERPR